jgi:hypothetical protein
MEIEPISRVGGAALPVVLPGADSQLSGSAAVAAALDEGLKVESETLEQRAENGDLIALEQLASDEKQMIPAASQQLLPAQPQQSPAHEAGKGDIIDIYD